MSIVFGESGRAGGGRRWPALLLALALMGGLAACGGDGGDGGDDSGEGGASSGSAAGAAADGDPSGTLRLGYFPNLTHAPAVIGVQDGLFEEALGGAEVEYTTFNSGTEASEALLTDSIDASFIGPNPAINAFAQSDGEAVRIVAGTTSGGASLVVREGIDDPGDLRGTTLATPSLGNTQDVALRAWLAGEGYETDQTGGGDVSISPQENADTLATFQDGGIDGAWVPEPWATRLVEEGGGHVLVDEAELWPGGRFVTTHLVVRTAYLEEHPENVRALIEGLLDAIDAANGDATAAQATTNDGIEEVTGSRLNETIIAHAWENLTFTPDPVAASLERSKDDAVEVGLLEEVDLEGIYDLSLLNEALASRGGDEVDGL